MSKMLRAGIASAALMSAFYVQAPAQARPPICVQWAWSRCDPHYDRLTPEWGACFEAMEAACEATQPGPPPSFPPDPPPFPWPNASPSGDDGN